MARAASENTPPRVLLPLLAPVYEGHIPAQHAELASAHRGRTVKADLPAARDGAASAVVDGKLWLMGGCTNYTPLSSVIIYDVATDTWAAGPELPRRMASCRAAVHDGKLHLTDQDGVYSHDNTGWGGVAGGTEGNTFTCGSILLG